MMRSIVAIVTGLIVASAVIAAGEFLRMRLASAPVAYGASDGTEAEIERSRRRLKNVSTLIGQGRYQDAIALLEEADRDPVAMQHLTVAYEKSGQKENADKSARTLSAFNEPVLEQAIVVVPFRKNHPATVAGNL